MTDTTPSQQTQPATQQILDPRRMGRNNSGLSDGDISDVLVILHPATPNAIKIVEHAAEIRPEHVLFRNSLDSMNESVTDIEEQETIIMDASADRIVQNSRAGADLALRMSSASRLKFKELGFIFGRNPNCADIVFGPGLGKKMSNQHFRIYLNEDGILMLQDMSTNGTVVDDALLRCKDNRFGNIRMLGSGSIICIQNTHDDDMIKFIVRIPSRVSYMERFRENLRNFIRECYPAAGQDQAKVQQIAKQFGMPTMKWDGGENYNIIGQIGKGAFATVYQLATKMTGKLLAVKELEKRRFMKNGMLDKKIDNEMQIMQCLRHPNIVEFIEFHDQRDYLYIIMEYVREGDLQAFLNQHGPLHEDTAKIMAQQILNALTHLHRSRITHRDIKPDNILIASFDPFTVKLSDFGLSKVVKHDETFLKTFCGTLLYCAPEVFPEYGAGPSKGTKRRRGAKTYHSYSSSVDIWSFGAVLWYALCGEPPFKGIADTTGEAMYNNIMTTPLDITPLLNARVSTTCADFLMRMLRTDPASRATNVECLEHPWLGGQGSIPDASLLHPIAEEEAEETEKQLSQLSIQEGLLGSEEEDDPLSDDEWVKLVTDRELKRVKADALYPRNQLRDHEYSSADPSFQSSHIAADEESFKAMPSTATKPHRLFGEIARPALHSSGFVGAYTAHALPREESFHEHRFGRSPHHGPEMAKYQSGSAAASQSFSSPSLLGAESLVRDMNMASPQSPVSRAQSPFMPATPTTPDVVQHSSLDQSSKHPSQISEPTPKARSTGINRQITLPLTASYFYNPLDPSTHNDEYATKVSGFDFVAAREAAEAGASTYEDTLRASDTSGCSAVSNSTALSADANVAAAAAAVPLIPAELDIKAPPRRLGKLIATPDSFVPGLTLNVDRSKTSWGRLANNTIVYENSRDTRIPKTAFIIFWYSPADQSQETVEDLSQRGKDWTSLDGLHVGIWTCATHGISINGKHLKQTDEKGRALFGHLYSGDIVQVYHDKRGTECLKFKCEFYLGCGKEPRPAGCSFDTLLGNRVV